MKKKTPKNSRHKTEMGSIQLSKRIIAFEESTQDRPEYWAKVRRALEID
jgi:hypothetical protein